jgi:hypothetical protein
MSAAKVVAMDYGGIPSKNSTQQSKSTWSRGRGIGNGTQQSNSEWERGERDGGGD